MRNTNFHKIPLPLLLTLILVFLLSACKTTQESPPTAVLPTETIALTETPLPSATSTPTVTTTATNTATATITPTPTQTLTPSQTPFKGFEEITLNSHQGSGELYLFIFGVPNVSQSYYVTVKKLPYQCNTDENFPDLLFCTGEPFENLDKEYLLFSFYEDEEMSKLVFEDYFFTGTFKKYKYLAIKGDPTTWCPERGENVTCETEYRMYNTKDGMVECIVSTCYDACGYYYSNDTCPADVPLSDYIFLPPPDER